MKVSPLKKEVAELLLNRQYKAYRDNDLRLVAHILNRRAENDLMFDEDQKATIKLFLQRFAKGVYENPESIRRCRQKLQELNHILRGKAWYKRHGIATVQMEEELYNHEYKISEIKF